MIYVQMAESATISGSFIFVKYSTLITEFSIYKLSSDLQRMDVRRYNGVLEVSLLQTQIPRISSTELLMCTMKWKL